MGQPAPGPLDNVSVPLPATGAAVEILASSALTTDPNTVSSIINVSAARRLTLWIKASVDAANAYLHLMPLVSAAQDRPVIGDDSWFGLAERDAAAVATLVTGSMPVGLDATIAPEWAVVTARPIIIRTESGDANTDEIRLAVTLDVTHARWFVLLAEEVTGNMTLQVSASVSN